MKRTEQIRAFSKLSLTDRLNWSFSQAQFFQRFMDEKSRRLRKEMHRNGKKYFDSSIVKIIESTEIKSTQD